MIMIMIMIIIIIITVNLKGVIVVTIILWLSCILQVCSSFVKSSGSFTCKYVLLAKKVYMWAEILTNVSAGCIMMTNRLNAASFMFSM